MPSDQTNFFIASFPLRSRVYMCIGPSSVNMRVNDLKDFEDNLTLFKAYSQLSFSHRKKFV